MKIRSPALADVLLVMNIVLPTAIGNALEYVPVCVAIALVGHGPEDSSAAELDAVALARAYFNMVAMAPGFGLIWALRTLCPQAVGAGQPRLCALYLQRSFVFILLGSLPIVPLLLFAGPVLRLAGQPEHLVALAEPYVVRMIPQC